MITIKQRLLSVLIVTSAATTWCMDRRSQLTWQEKQFLLTQCAQRLHGHADIVESVASHPDSQQIKGGL